MFAISVKERSLLSRDHLNNVNMTVHIRNICNLIPRALPFEMRERILSPNIYTVYLVHSGPPRNDQSAERLTLTKVETRYNEPLHNEVLGITNDFPYPSNSKIYGK